MRGLSITILLSLAALAASAQTNPATSGTVVETVKNIAVTADNNSGWPLVTADPQRGRFYIGNVENLNVVDVSTGSVKVIPLPPGPNAATAGMSSPPVLLPNGMVVTESQQFGAVDSINHFPWITATDPDTGTAAIVYQADQNGPIQFIQWMASSLDGKLLYVAGGDPSGPNANFFALDTATWKIVKSWSLGPPYDPHTVNVLADGTLVLTLWNDGWANGGPFADYQVLFIKPDGSMIQTDLKSLDLGQRIVQAPDNRLYIGAMDYLKNDDWVGLILDPATGQIVDENHDYSLGHAIISVVPGTWREYTLDPWGDGGMVLTWELQNWSTRSSPFIAVNVGSFASMAVYAASDHDVLGILEGSDFVIYSVPWPSAYPLPSPLVSPGGVVNAATFKRDVSPGSLVSVFGSSFTLIGDSVQALPLPDNLADVQAFITGSDGKTTAAPMLYASEAQLNLQLPSSIPPGPATVKLVWADYISSPPVSFTVQAAAPGIFEVSQAPIITDASGTVVGTAGRPLQPGQPYTIWATGLGKTACTGTLPDGSAPKDASCVLIEPPVLTIGGRTATILFAGLAPGLVGVDQVNFSLPAGSGSAGSGSTNQTSPLSVAGILAAGGASATFQVTISP